MWSHLSILWVHVLQYNDQKEYLVQHSHDVNIPIVQFLVVRITDEFSGTAAESSQWGCGGAGGEGTGAGCGVHPLPQSPVYDIVGIADAGDTNSKMTIGRTMDKPPKVHSFIICQSVVHAIY